MKVQLKSNGTQHEIPSATWEKMSRDQKSSYTVISKTDTVDKPQVAINKTEEKAESKKAEKPENGDKK